MALDEVCGENNSSEYEKFAVVNKETGLDADYTNKIWDCKLILEEKELLGGFPEVVRRVRNSPIPAYEEYLKGRDAKIIGKEYARAELNRAVNKINAICAVCEGDNASGERKTAELLNKAMILLHGDKARNQYALQKLQ